MAPSSPLLRWTLWACLCAAPLALARPARAFSHDPRLAWRTLSTPHFDVNFYPATAGLATRTAALCERRFGELAAYFKFQPSDRIQVILADETDEANGSASALPYNTIDLIVAPPDEEMEVWDVDAWLDTVISHELTHIFHLDHDRGFPHWLRRCFGRVAWSMPNYFQPAWVLEGLAAWAETDTARRVGRGQDPFYRGLMRVELQGGLKPLRKVNQPLVTWPGGSTRYLYGVYFMQYLADTYGRDSVRRWVVNYSNNWVPYFINRNARKTFHQDLPALWAGFHAWLNRNLGAETRAIEARGLRGGPAPVADGGGDDWGPYKAGYAVRRDGLTRPKIQRLKGGRWETLGQAYVAEFWPGPKRILYTEDERNGWVDDTRDLWQMDPRSGCRRRLTHGLRVQEAVETPMGVYAVLGGQGQKRLVRLEHGRVAELLWQGKDGEDLGSLCASPDGRRLAASYWRQGYGWDVAEFDLASRAWILRASRPEPEVQPSYSPDGRTLYFSAAYGGTYNIYALDLSSTALTQLTNVVGGAFHPWPGRHDDVYFSMMTPRGMALGVVALDPAAAPATLGPPPPPPTVEALSPLSGAQEGPYHAGATLMPTAWFPTLGASTQGLFGGVQVAGDDLLDRHHFQALVYAGGGLADVFGGLSYAYTRWLPQMGVLAEKTLSVDLSGPGYRNRLDQRWEATASVPWQGTWRSLQLEAAAGADWHRDDGGDLDAPPLDSAEQTAFGVGLVYDASALPARALGSIDGLQASMTYERDDPGLADDHAWFNGSLARPTRLAPWLELEASLGGGHVTLGAQRFSLALTPLVGLDTGPLSFHPSFGMAGYGGGQPALSGPSYGQAELGLRFPIALVEWGVMAPPIGVDRIFGRVWGQSAQAYGAAGEGQGLFNAVGAEVDTDFILFYAADVELTLGVDRGLDGGGQWAGYARLTGVNFSTGGGGAHFRRTPSLP